MLNPPLFSDYSGTWFSCPGLAPLSPVDPGDHFCSSALQPVLEEGSRGYHSCRERREENYQ